MRYKCWYFVVAALLLGACTSTQPDKRQSQAASAIEFLYPGREATTPIAVANIAEIKIPFRVGLAFVPDNADPRFRITEVERMDLLSSVRQAFQRYPFVASIEAIPSSYLRHGGSFDNLDRVANMLSLDCIVLLSYDQMQFADLTGWSWLYWTGIGAYMVSADRYDVLTSVEATVFDVRSRKLLMRAGGTSQVKGEATMVGFGEKAREARSNGFRDALQKLIPNLHAEVKAFRERAPGDRSIRLDLPPGYDPNAVR
jgi:rhombotail lipoprotein